VGFTSFYPPYIYYQASVGWVKCSNQSAGLQHILSHIADFTKRGILPNEIADAVMTAVTQGNVVNYQRKRPIYEFMYKGKKQLLAVTVSDNGFIVGANPASFK
jgi:hypothetical protein